MMGTPVAARAWTWQRTSTLLELSTSPRSTTCCRNGPEVAVAMTGAVAVSSQPTFLEERLVPVIRSARHTTAIGAPMRTAFRPRGVEQRRRRVDQRAAAKAAGGELAREAAFIVR